MDFFHVCVFTFFTWKSIYGSISIVGYGSLQLNSPFLLACYIPSFNSGATWSNSNLQPMTCTSDGFCQLTSIDNVMFSANESGIIVIIDPLLEKDDHIQWTCFYDSKNISYTVEISSISIVGYGSLQLNSPFLLACYIPSFNSGATWSNSNLQPMTCTSDGFCQLTSIDNVMFSANESGIIVIIDPLLEKDDHIQWTCFYDSKNISYTVEISSAYPSGQKKSETISGGVIAVIVIISCLLFVPFIWSIASFVWCLRNSQKFRFSS